MKKILYVDNNNNFFLFFEIAKKSTLAWHFIIFDKKKEMFLKEAGIGYSTFKIFRHKSERSLDCEIYSSAIKADRVLRFFPKKIALSILKRQADFFYQCMNSFNPDIILGEISWANEYVFYKISEQQGKRYRHLLNLPLKDNRVVAFDCEHSFNSLLELQGLNNQGGGGMSYSELSTRVKERNGCSNGIKNGLLRLFNISSQVNDYRLNQVYWKLRKGVSLLYRQADIFLDNMFYDLPSLINKVKGKKVIYLSLHIQPESTPDFVSLLFSDQLKLIEDLACILDENIVIVVKDHPNNISIRNISQIKKLISYHNVFFLKRHESVRDIIDMSSVVCSVAGTVTLEAIERGKPAIVFSNIFYNKSKFVYSVASMADFRDALNQCFSCKDEVVNDLDLTLFGIRAFIHDPEIFPEVLNTNNIEALVALIDEL
ncbi:hypothetical protein ACS016_14565 [Aeromonas veronii]|uniref:hypothetical protein n=1 Tax=Aeromonas veronii TaxID=654 RepID=UPI003F7BC755